MVLTIDGYYGHITFYTFHRTSITRFRDQEIRRRMLAGDVDDNIAPCFGLAPKPRIRGPESVCIALIAKHTGAACLDVGGMKLSILGPKLRDRLTGRAFPNYVGGE
ncbi:hypothetical protein EVAR_100881_1 [Eumeta japonica]|uniref:Uncharacterized protein n=1 Tax=Eumeta variegata TaxID=151549 RepID=A0A4C1SBW0_EUMVA|nr:hypothetical protein EVAR_100881_1 [Eumeta japonica]